MDAPSARADDDAADGAASHREAPFLTRAAMFFVYIMSSMLRCLYTGITNDLVRRVGEHRDRPAGAPSFARRYNTRRLVYFEVTDDVRAAIAREKEIKRWRRARKLALITRHNPQWIDLAARWPEIDAPPC